MQCTPGENFLQYWPIDGEYLVNCFPQLQLVASELRLSWHAPCFKNSAHFQSRNESSPQAQPGWHLLHLIKQFLKNFLFYRLAFPGNGKKSCEKCPTGIEPENCGFNGFDNCALSLGGIEASHNSKNACGGLSDLWKFRGLKLLPSICMQDERRYPTVDKICPSSLFSAVSLVSNC